MTRMEIVAGIPVDLQAKATPDIKRLLLVKLANITNYRQEIEQAATQERLNKIMAAYRDSVGFKEKMETIRKAEQALKEAEESLFKVGLNSDGTLIQPQLRIIGGKKVYSLFIKNTWIELTVEQRKVINDAKKLVDAVHSATDSFSVYDQLETRLVMASTVGECMAVINAAADRDVFNISPVALKLKDKEDKKPGKLAAGSK